MIGAGTGGYATALRAAQLGLRVALVERDDRLGGTCLIRGCIPTKALLQSAAVLDTVNRASEWGIKAAGEADWSAIRRFEDAIVEKNVKGLTGLVKLRGIDVDPGHGPFGDEPPVSRSTAAVWSPVTSSSPPAPTLDCLPDVEVSTHVITSDQALELDRIPESAVVIGAGAVGLEFASLYRSLGAEVTLVEALPRLAPLEDEEVSKEIARAVPEARHHHRRRRGGPERSATRARRRGRPSTPVGPSERWSPISVWSRSDADPSPTTSASTRPASRATSAATSWSTRSCGRARSTSGRSATSPTRPSSSLTSRSTRAMRWPNASPVRPSPPSGTPMSRASRTARRRSRAWASPRRRPASVGWRSRSRSWTSARSGRRTSSAKEAS